MISQTRFVIALGFGLMFMTHVFAQSEDGAFAWPVSTPEAEQVDPQMIATLVQNIEAGTYGRQKSLMILVTASSSHEQYFRGFDQDDQMAMYSATKSWGSALMGVAIRNGDLAGTSVPLAQILTAYPGPFAASPQKLDITLHDILTMRHGLAWDEWSTSFTSPANPVNQMLKTADWWKYVLERPLTAAPDTVFRYSTGTSNLMGAVVYNLTGQRAIDYSNEHLFNHGHHRLSFRNRHHGRTARHRHHQLSDGLDTHGSRHVAQDRRYGKNRPALPRPRRVEVATPAFERLDQY